MTQTYLCEKYDCYIQHLIHVSRLPVVEKMDFPSCTSGNDFPFDIWLKITNTKRKRFLKFITNELLSDWGTPTMGIATKLSETCCSNYEKEVEAPQQIQRRHRQTNLKKIETVCYCGFWKLISLTVFQSLWKTERFFFSVVCKVIK